MPPRKDTGPINAVFDMPGPHEKGVLTTRLGRFVERAAYLDLLLAAAIVLLLGALYCCSAPKGNGLICNGEAVSPGFFESLYFCIITFTTLGYGDLSPVGFGRLAATLIVMSGLVLTALLIGKFASERQQSTLLLLYTSDAQRRLDGFRSQIEGLRTQLERFVLRGHGTRRLVPVLQSLENAVEATFSYVIFNANQARLVEFGNTSALNALYRELSSVQEACASIRKLAIDDISASDRAMELARRLADLMKVMTGFHRKTYGSHIEKVVAKMKIAALHFCHRNVASIDARTRRLRAPDSRSLARKIKRTIRQLLTYLDRNLRIADATKGVHVDILRKMSAVVEDLNDWVQRSETPEMLTKVLVLVPAGPPAGWPKTLNALIGEQLNVKPSLVGQCITSLRRQGRLPKL